MYKEQNNLNNKTIIETIDNSVDFIVLLQGILSNAVTDITLSQLNQGITKNTQSYLNKIKKFYIDYSDIDEKFREQLDPDSRSMLEASIKNNFAEYCRCSCLQIEAVLQFFKDKNSAKYEKFIDEDKHYKTKENKQDFKNNFRKKAVYDFWFSTRQNSTRDIRDKEYNTIWNIMQIRDIASHTTLDDNNIPDENNTPFERKLQNKHKKLKEFYDKKEFINVKNKTEIIVRNILLNPVIYEENVF